MMGKNVPGSSMQGTNEPVKNTLGKNKCRILKEIRRKIADENDIPYVTHECRFRGECSGTCPRCESELRYLEKELEARARAGKRIAIAAICAGMTLGLAGCTTPFSSKTGTEQADELSGAAEPMDDEVYVTTGEAAPPEDPEDTQDSGDTKDTENSGTALSKDLSENENASSERTDEWELSGDVVYVEENSANE